MLAQLLNREFLLKSMEKLSQGIKEQAEHYDKGDPAVAKLMEEAGVDVDDLRRAGDEFEEALGREKPRLREKLDDIAFFPRDPVLGLAQSALQQFCEEKKSDSIQNGTRGASAAQNIAVTDEEIDDSLAMFLSGSPPQRGLWGKYELLDIGWANCLAAIGVRAWRGRHPFNNNPAEPFQISNRARVILLSDWASGLPRARKVSGVIREILDEADAASRDKHVLHLGDVYYSGHPSEYEDNFLAYWPVEKKEADNISSWSLNANHDMYSGGWGYFDYLLRDDIRFKGHKDSNGIASSFFSLENDNWLILGLDTGYHEDRIFDPHDLYGGQAEWVKERLSSAPQKKGILLSHHQPFSSYEEGGENLLEKLANPLKAGSVGAWFWGHEHRCVLYEPRENIMYPRCIGHGGAPFHVPGAPPAGVAYEYRQGFYDLLESWNYFGFVVMDFEGEAINVRYVNERGLTHHEEVIHKN